MSRISEPFDEAWAIVAGGNESDPANAAWQRDLWVSYWRVANVLEQQDSEDATDYWRRAQDTLAAMVDIDLFVSQHDMQFFDRLRARVDQR